MKTAKTGGSQRPALQAGGSKRALNGFNARYLPLVLAVAAAGCERTGTGAQDGPQPGATAGEGNVDHPAAPSGSPPLLVGGTPGEIAPEFLELGKGELDGLVLAPGVYAWSTMVSIPARITLAGGTDDVWVFRIARDLVVAGGASVLLTGGAQARNVFWQVAGRATLGAGATVVGTIQSPVPISQWPGVAVAGRSPEKDPATVHVADVNLP